MYVIVTLTGCHARPAAEDNSNQKKSPKRLLFSDLIWIWNLKFTFLSADFHDCPIGSETAFQIILMV